MNGVWTGLWFLAPLLWLFWARGGLPGPTLRFPRGALLSGPALRPSFAGWLIFVGLTLWASTLVWPSPNSLTNSTLFLVDNSSSMAEPALLDGAKIGTRLDLGRQIFEEQLRTLDKSELVGLVRFSSMPRVLAPLTRERGEVFRLLGELVPESTPLEAQTNLVDALVEGLTRVLAVPASHQRILLWTDGEANVRATASNWSLETVAEAIRVFGVELVILDGGPPMEALDPDEQIRQGEAQSLLLDLAKTSGGRFIASGKSLMDFALEHPKGKEPPSALWRMIVGWLLAWIGLFFWWNQTRIKPQTGALARSLVWPKSEIQAFRTFAALAGLGLLCGLLSLGLLFWQQSATTATKGILIDLRQGMLAGQPTRLERTRSLLEVSLQKALAQTPKTCELGLWIMGATPVCVLAPTKDWSAILDELPRLEAWAEDSQIGKTADPKGLPLPRRGLWFWEGRGASPFAEGLPLSWSIVDVASTESALAHRLGESRQIAGDPGNLQRLGNWGRTLALETCQGALARFFVADGDSGFTRFLWTLGLLSFALMALFPRGYPGLAPYLKLQSSKGSRAALASTVWFMALLGAGMTPLYGQSVTDWMALQRRLEALSGQSPVEVGNGAKALIKDLEQLTDKPDPQWIRLHFLTRAALWRSLGPSQGNPSQGNSKGPKDKGGDLATQKGKAEPGNEPFSGNPSHQEFPLSGQERQPSPLEGPLAGMNPNGPTGLWQQLNEAQKKVAREATTRRLGHIIQRPWDSPRPGEPK